MQYVAMLIIIWGWSGMEGEPRKYTHMFYAESKADATRACEAYGKERTKILAKDIKTTAFWAGYTCL